jgi:hypothetical protein
MSTQRRGLSLAALGMTALLAGCAVGPDYRRPDVALPSSYPQSDQAPAGQGTVSPEWWKLYNDATLNGLIDATLKNNVDMRKAIAQIDEAEAVFAEASTGLFPEIDLNASSTKARSSTLTAQKLPPGTPALRTRLLGPPASHLGVRARRGTGQSLWQGCAGADTDRHHHTGLLRLAFARRADRGDNCNAGIA